MRLISTDAAVPGVGFFLKGTAIKPSECTSLHVLESPSGAAAWFGTRRSSIV
jgi:hypothetical protein